MSKKVYCNDCRYDGAGGKCWHPNNFVVKDTPYRREGDYVEYMNDRNKNNDCKHFEPTWFIRIVHRLFN